MEELLLADAMLPNGRHVDVRIADGRVVALDPPRAADPNDGTRIALDGALVGPAFVEGHIHLDKTLLGTTWRPHRVGGSISERIAAERALLREVDVPVVERALNLVRQIVGFGTGYVRSHVDVDPNLGLGNLHALLEVRERCRDLVDLQIVAFPQSGVVKCPGTAEILDAALRDGADLVGGLDPAGIDGDVEGQLDVVFDLAERYGKGVDIHLHDPGESGTFQLRRIAERTAALGMQGMVAVSHAWALGMVDERELEVTAEALACGDVAIMTNAPGAVAMPPVLALRAAGVRVFAGSDNVRDAWWPYGNGDMLERAMLIGYRQGMYTDDELRLAYDLATTEAALALGLSDYELKVGASANLVAIQAPAVPEAVATHAPRRLTVHQGRVVSQQEAGGGLSVSGSLGSGRPERAAPRRVSAR